MKCLILGNLPGFADGVRRQFEFPAAQYFKTVSQKQNKLQFFFIRLKKMLNSLT